MHRSPLQSDDRRSVILRGLAGAAICAAAFACVVLLAPVVSRWLDGTNPARPDAPGALANVPDDIGPALRPDTAAAKHKHRAHAKAKTDERTAVVVGGNVVILNGPGAAAPASPANPANPAPADAAPAPVAATRPVKPKAPKKAPPVGTDESNPVAPAVTTPVAANAAAATGLVRLSVQSVGVSPNSSGDPELNAKLGISGAQSSDALPDSITLHLRPQIPATLQSNGAPLALRTSVDMVDAPRATAADPALRLRVRMTIAPSQIVTAASAPVVEDPGPGDGKSNVVAVTVPLTSFVRVAPDDPTTPPDNQGPGDPTTPPDNQGPGDTPQDPAPGDPTGGDPTTPQQPGDPTAPGGDPTTPGDPGTTPGQPTGGDPTTPPQEPAPTDPTTPGQPTAGDPTTPPETEIFIPVGPTRPNEQTTTLPLPADPTGEAPAVDPVQVIVIVEELPPDEPPVDPADGSTPVVQDPGPEVVTPPADTVDPGTAPAPDATPADGTAIVVSADAPPAPTSSS